MPPRLIDFDALWSSDKLLACAMWARREYSWLYGLADAHGSFELTNIRVIHGRVAPIREDLSLERLSQIFDEFHERGLLFTWEHGSKRYGHWTNCERRLPPKSSRDRYARLAPPAPEKELAEYLAKFSGHPLDPNKTTSRRPLEFAMTGEGEGEGEGKGKIRAPAQAETLPSPLLAFSGTHFKITEQQDRTLGQAFPWVDRQAEYRRMESWLEANSGRRVRKHSQFAHNWFSKISAPSAKGGSHGHRRPSGAINSDRQPNLRADHELEM